MGQDLYERIETNLRNTKIEVSSLDKEFLINSIEPSIGIKTHKIEDVAISIGTSKIGGKPDLPANFQWPLYNNEPLAFCAQFNCQELISFDQKSLLSSNGMLYVFIYIDTTWPGFISKRESFKIIYLEHNQNLIRTSFPVGYFVGGIFDPARINFFQYFTLPYDENFKIADIKKRNTNFFGSYDKMREIIDKETEQLTDNYHQLLGEDRSVQASVVFNFAEKELNIRTEQDFNSNKELLIELQKKYVILLQLDCNDKNSNLHKYGGSSVIYFGLTAADLKERKFDKVIMAFQGT